MAIWQRMQRDIQVLRKEKEHGSQVHKLNTLEDPLLATMRYLLHLQVL